MGQWSVGFPREYGTIAPRPSSSAVANNSFLNPVDSWTFKCRIPAHPLGSRQVSDNWDRFVTSTQFLGRRLLSLVLGAYADGVSLPLGRVPREMRVLVARTPVCHSRIPYLRPEGPTALCKYALRWRRGDSAKTRNSNYRYIRASSKITERNRRVPPR